MKSNACTEGLVPAAMGRYYRDTSTELSISTDHLNAALTGRYSIEKQIGAGGMATVFLARDLRHNRQVALKVLNPELGAVLGPDRFMAEIEVTANLHHPNLLPLFDSGEAQGMLFYVMPYIEGETLRARLGRERQLPIDEALRIANAIASALDYAHRHGVIHRDLKPENILMHEGQPLVMDFGIALALAKAGGARITQTGLSLGTPQYMSPEQATGDHALDARTDIYSLGAVLYEMLVGDPPHTGSTVQAVIAKVITERPSSVRATRPNVSENVEAALMMALAKLPADRFATAADFSAALTGQRPVSMPGDVLRTNVNVTPTVAKASRWRAAREGVAWMIALAALGLIGWRFAGTKPAPATLGTFELALPDSVDIRNQFLGFGLAISRDGSMTIVRGRLRGGAAVGLWLRRANDPTAQFVRGTEGAAGPSFSPDGEWLLFRVDEGAVETLQKVPVTGGTPSIVARAESGKRLGLTASWGDGDQVLFTMKDELWLTTPQGANPRLLAAIDSSAGILGYGQPHMLPGGTHALVRVRYAAERGLEVSLVALADGSVTGLGFSGNLPRYGSGYIVYERDGTLQATAFSLRGMRVTGPNVRLMEAAEYALAGNGWLVRTTGGDAPTSTVVLVDRSGRERPLRPDARTYGSPAISPDGRRLALTVGALQFNTGDIWIHEMSSGAFARLTSDGVSYRSHFSPDGARVVHVSGRGQGTRIVSRPWDGSGTETVLLARAQLGEIAPGPAGMYSAIRSMGSRDLYVSPTDSLAVMAPFVMSPANETSPRVSPDGRWLAYQSDETGRSEVYVRSLPGPGARVAVSVDGGSGPRWSADGTELFYRGMAHVMSARIAKASEFSVERRDTLFADNFVADGDNSGWDVMPNGREFVFLKPVGLSSNSRVMLVVNWPRMITGAATLEQNP